MPFFKVFWHDSTKGINPRSTDCEADAQTTTPSRRFITTTERILFVMSRYVYSLMASFRPTNDSGLNQRIILVLRSTNDFMQ